MKKLATALALSLGLFSAAQATTLTFTSVDNGWYSSDGTHGAGNSNTITGWYSGQTYNSYFNFNLTGLAGQSITSATLTFNANNGDYASPDVFEQLEIWDVVGTPGQGSSTTVFNDLMSGTKYGQVKVNGSAGRIPMPQVTVTLNSSAYADILADSSFSVGGHVSTISGTAQQTLWAGSYGIGAATLTLDVQPSAVPEPSTLALFGIACAGLGALRRRKSA